MTIPLAEITQIACTWLLIITILLEAAQCCCGAGGQHLVKTLDVCSELEVCLETISLHYLVKNVKGSKGKDFLIEMKDISISFLHDFNNICFILILLTLFTGIIVLYILHILLYRLPSGLTLGFCYVLSLPRD